VKRSRDEFSEEVKRIVAQRVGHRCSRCDAPTSGPRLDPAKALNVGVAGHITAAAPGGPRYNPSLTPEQRKHHTNAIWLCQTCGKLVDNDQSMFTVDDLRRWKLAAEARALGQIGRSNAAQSQDRHSLSPEEMEILIAAEANNGEISVLSTDETAAWVRAGRHDFIDLSDRAVAATYRDGLRSLIRRGLVEHSGGSAYDLTGSGFAKARELKRLRDDMGADDTH
jgi:hypothetical protein